MNLPATHRVCENCGRRFRLFQLRSPTMPTRGNVFHHLDQAGHFCTQKCSTKYAVSAVRASALGARR